MIAGTDVKKRVLIVDDDPRIGYVLGFGLKVEGYEVITTTDGAEAIELIRVEKPDLVLLDVVMPVSGLEVLCRVRTFSQVPIILFTGRPEVVQLGLQMGANDSIAKPCGPDLLAEKIEFVLSARHAGGAN
jgi:DNA-binding response OmpR family regulator